VITRRRPFLLAAVLLIAMAGASRASTELPAGPFELELTGLFRSVHDPVIAQHDGRFYLFSTGAGIPIRCSDDLRHWEPCGLVFLRLPAWARPHVPAARDIWAPDISYFGGRYHLYFSVSSFGSNVSAIGLATNVTLDRDDPEYAWVDHGIVIASHGVEDWNAIDPNVVVTPSGEVWLSFGSFWTGIKLRRLDPATGMPCEQDPTLHAIASRPVHPRAVEAPFIIERHGDYYLFVSFDQCCSGLDSTYNIRVGRAPQVTGPYVDRDGVAMLEGGGTLLVGPSARWPGSGHNAVVRVGDQDLLVYHGYDAAYGGGSALRIEVLAWDEDGWPITTWQP
jgi:arabinan endo-1,5-alpha-L-arabinosidase